MNMNDGTGTGTGTLRFKKPEQDAFRSGSGSVRYGQRMLEIETFSIRI